jgi:siroheme synthase-like protein
MTLPLAVELAGRCCLVVGSSGEAEQRVARFLGLGARVRWVRAVNAPVAAPVLFNLADVEVRERAFEATDVDGCWLVILADQDAPLASAVRAACDQRQAFFCAIDQPELNTCNHMAILDLDPVQIAISTRGAVPLLARRLREELAALFGGSEFATFVRTLVELRATTPRAERKQRLLDALQGFRIEGRVRLPGRKE